MTGYGAQAGGQATKGTNGMSWGSKSEDKVQQDSYTVIYVSSDRHNFYKLHASIYQL